MKASSSKLETNQPRAELVAPLAATSIASKNTINTVPLCVDLDGTLISSDLLWESILLLARSAPLDLLRLPIWLAKGKSVLKSKLADRIIPDPATLPYRHDFVDFLRAERQRGRMIILATASETRVAKAVANHLQLFDYTVASSAQFNCRGTAKVAAIRDYLGPEATFDYAGDSAADLKVWLHARETLLVYPRRGVRSRLPHSSVPSKIFQSDKPLWLAFIKAARPHQWAKNILLFIPIIAGHEINNLAKLGAAAMMFIAMGCVASSVYVTNDLLDLSADRQHATKRFRPFAAGTLSIPTGMAMATILLAVGLCLGEAADGVPAIAMLTLYIVMSNSYSLYFKRKSLLDVIMLALLYTHRIVAGCVVTEIWPTAWLMAFSMFMFISLAFAKRYSELTGAANRGRHGFLAGRGYKTGDLDIIRVFGAGSGLCAILVLCLYINDPQTLQNHYPHPEILWVSVPLLLYWIMRLWLRAQRYQLDEDPVLFAMRDRNSYLIATIIAISLMLASVHKF